MESLSMQLQPFFEWLLRTTLQASLLICFILLFQAVLRNKLGARWHYCLWLLLLIRMAMPWAPQSRLSVFNLIPQSLPQRQTEYIQQDVGGPDAVSSDAASPSTAESTPVSTTGIPQDSSKAITVAPEIGKEAGSQLKPLFSKAADILPLIWLTGALALAVYVCASNFNLLRIVKRERPLTDQKILDLLEDCKAEMGIRIILGVVATDKVKSPALFGFVRPRLLLPKGMLDTLSREELRYVFLHELAHLKRHDIYIGWLMSLLQVLHWFNPLIWLAFYRVRTDRELACDALVLARTQSGQAKDYGRTIVNLLERFSRSQRLPAMAGILETKAQLKRRIIMIARFKKDSYRWSPLAIVFIIVLACVALPDAIQEKTFAKPGRHITLRQVWSGPGVDAGGAPSPDGRFLSYTDWETGDLAIRELATGKTRHLTKKGTWKQPMGFALNSVISPNNRLVAYSWMNEHGTYDLCVIGIDGLGDRTLYSSKDHELYPTSWSSDGKQIAARKYTTKEGYLDIILVSVEDESIQVLKTFEEPPFSARLCYLTDDRFVVYDFPVADNSGNYDISLISTDGTGEIPLIEHPANDRLLGCVPNREEILFTSDRTGTHDVWAIKVVNGKVQGSPRPITRDIGQISPQGFAENGSFYFNKYTRRFTTQIFPFDAETGEIQKESKKPLLGSNFAAEWSPDGESLAYVTEKTKPAGPGWYHRPLHVRNLKTGQERELAGEIEVIAPRWSPDGRFILVTGYDSNKRHQKDYNGGIYKIDVQDGHVTELVQFPPVEKWSRDNWSRSISELAIDGKAVFYKNRGKIIRRELESGMEKQLYRNNELVRLLKLSPDGKRLAFAAEVLDEGKASIMVIPVSGGEPRELFEFKDPKRGMRIPMDVAWTPDGNYILFEKREEKGSTVWRVSSEGGNPEVIWRSKDRVLSLSVHPNREKIAVSTIIQEHVIWVMENFLPGAPVAKPEPAMTLRKIEHEWGGFASISTDGKYMCDLDTDTGDLAICEITTGKKRRLTSKGSWEASSEYALDSAISPDSKEVAYLWYDHNTKASSLHAIGLDGSGERLLCKGKYAMPRDWSADGSKILTIVLYEETNEMVWVSASDGSIRRITSVGKGYPGKFDISPDGRFIAYDRPQAKNTSKRDIFVFDLSEDRENPVVKHPDNDRLLGWTPDGKYIFFASNRTGTWDGWLLQVAGGEPQGFPKLVKQDIGDVTPIGFMQTGSYYYRNGQTLRDICMATLDLETGKVLSEPVPVRQTGATICHDWSPDGQYLAYCTRSPDKSQIIHIRTLATSQERMLADNLPYIRWLRWSLDGQSILIDRFKRGDSQGVIFKIDVQTGERTDLVRSETEVLLRPELSPDGKTLFYIRGDPVSKTGRLVARDLQSGREKELFRNVPPARLTGSALSPDGQRFVLSIIPSLTRPAAPVLKILSAAGGEPRELIQFDKSEKLLGVGVTWMPDSQDVLFWKWFRVRGGKDLELWRISAEGGEPRKLWAWKTLGHLRVHPDGQRIAFNSRSTTSEVWVMENFLPTGVSQAK